MRVLYPFAAEQPGGAEYSAKALMSGLADLGHDLVYTAPAGSDVDRLFTPVARRIDAPDLGQPPRARVKRLWWLWRAARDGAHFLRDMSIDVVHSNSGDMQCAWAIASARRRIPHVWHQRNVYFPPSILQRPRFLADRIAWPTARVVAVSDYARTAVPSNLQARTVTIRDPVMPLQEVNRFRPGTQVTLVFIGRFVESKRPEIVLDVLSHLQASRREKELVSAVLIGSGEAEREAALDQRARELSVEGSVRFLPWQTDPYAAVTGSAILLFPAEREAYGRVLVEAMMSGMPVVAADEGGIREIVEHGRTGLLANPGDVDDFAAKVQWLLSNPEATARIVVQARKWAMDMHHLDAHVDAVLDVYRSPPRPGLRGWLARG